MERTATSRTLGSTSLVSVRTGAVGWPHQDALTVFGLQRKGLLHRMFATKWRITRSLSFCVTKQLLHLLYLQVQQCIDQCKCSNRVCVCLAALSGAGRRVGENMEQAWAQARPVMKLTRYMTKQGYVAGLDDIFLQIADDKLLECV